MTMWFTKDHEWVRVEDGNTATVGITHYAQEQLGDVVFVELPEVGRSLAKGEEAAVVESVKAASEVYSPVAGEVVAFNKDLPDAPGTVNTSPENEGWFYQLKLDGDPDTSDLMDQAAYDDYVASL
ncbi:glycine cleavage system protein GcvH [Caenispirillum salinarum]|uniref:glycine cleavage system protein GcvH n=1 Tax=Caenispirillum salinarum TaxID=859058 RepID=UPI0002E1F774|nr:glycine cleavage system protein GcvH [Caenispirillum salinarum]